MPKNDTPMLTYAQIFALTTRADLLAAEAEIVSNSNQNWAGRLMQFGDYGTRGGSASDRRAIVEAMAHLERMGKLHHQGF